MIAIADMLNTLKCLMLREAGNLVSYYNLDIKCPEMDEVKDRFKTSVKYHMLLSNSEYFNCSLDSGILCDIESFVKQNPCTCTSCTASCPNFDITKVSNIVNCNGFLIKKL